MAEPFIRFGSHVYLRSDNGPEFTTEKMRGLLARLDVIATIMEPGSPRENGYNESFNGTLRRELLSRGVFDTLLKALVLSKRWRQEYNEVRLHSSLGYRPHAPESTVSFEELAGSALRSKAYSKVELYRLN